MTSLYANRPAVLRSIVECYLEGQHCAEVMFGKLGQYYDPDFDPALARIATGFGGPAAEASDVCGALAGGLMVIGYLFGRSDAVESHEECWRFGREFRERFLGELGGTSCYHFTGGEFNQHTHRQCAAVVARAATLLLDLLPVSVART